MLWRHFSRLSFLFNSTKYPPFYPTSFYRGKEKFRKLASFGDDTVSVSTKRQLYKNNIDPGYFGEGLISRPSGGIDDPDRAAGNTVDILRSSGDTCASVFQERGEPRCSLVWFLLCHTPTLFLLSSRFYHETREIAFDFSNTFSMVCLSLFRSFINGIINGFSRWGKGYFVTRQERLLIFNSFGNGNILFFNGVFFFFS